MNLEQLKKMALPIAGAGTIATATVLWTEIVDVAHAQIPHDQYMLVASFEEYTSKQEMRAVMSEINDLRAELRELKRLRAMTPSEDVEAQLLDKDIQWIEKAIADLEAELAELAL